MQNLATTQCTFARRLLRFGEAEYTPRAIIIAAEATRVPQGTSGIMHASAANRINQHGKVHRYVTIEVRRRCMLNFTLRAVQTA